MSAYQVGGKSNFVIGPKRLPGGVAIGRVSTGTKDKRRANAMERAIDELAVQGWGDLIARLGSDLRLPDLYAAKIEGPAALQAIRDQKTDPPLETVLAKAESYIADDRTRHGIAELRTYLRALDVQAPAFSWIQKPANLNRLYAHARSTGRPPNSIRRSLHRAVCEILSHELGRGQMLAIMADVRKPAANDERTVNLTPAQIQALLEPMDEQTRPIVEFALLTGIDMAPILRLRPMDYDPESGTVSVDDRKAVLRKRRVPIPATAEAIVRRQAAGKPEDQPLFELGRWQLQRRYDTARKAAGLGHVRFKDLRGIFATNYISGGGSPKDLMAIMGHSSMTMTLRYIRRSATAGRKEGMDAAAEKMGLGMRQILKVEKGGA